MLVLVRNLLGGSYGQVVENSPEILLVPLKKSIELSLAKRGRIDL